MAPTASFDDNFNEVYIDSFDDEMKRRRDAKIHALDVSLMTKHYGKRVILIEEVDGERLGVLDAIIVNAGDPTKLRLVNTNGFQATIDISQPLMFDWEMSKYFMKSTFWRRRKYLSPKAREHRALCHRLFDMALGRGLFAHDDIALFRECSLEDLRRVTSSRWDAPEDITVDQLLTRLEGV
jgi:hypothetical protein